MYNKILYVKIKIPGRYFWISCQREQKLKNGLRVAVVGNFRQKGIGKTMKRFKKLMDIISEHYWAIALTLFAIGFVDVCLVAKIMHAVRVAIPGTIVFGIGTVMMLVPLCINLFDGLFDRY